jgi:hypothetical protein
MSKFVESLSGESADKWLLRALSPAFVFWAVGVLAITGSLKSVAALEQLFDKITAQNELHLILPLIAAVAGSAASAWIVERFTLPVTRLLEGYWPDLCGFRQWCVTAAQKRRDKIYSEWVELSVLPDPSMQQKRRRLALDEILQRTPPDGRLLPTRLGNILRASETRPISKYGLDAVICWPRLWLLLPDANREDVAAARDKMDDGVRLVLWGILSLVWGIWVWWLVPIAVVVIFVSYYVTLLAAADFSDLVEAVFDTRRTLLYDALGWPLPKTPAEETDLGEALTKFLVRGSDDPTPQLQFRKSAD